MKTALTLHTATLILAAAATLVLNTLPAQADEVARNSADTRTEVHKMGQHPAVIVHARLPQIDPNLFLVQPPVQVTWTVRPADDSTHQLASASASSDAAR